MARYQKSVMKLQGFDEFLEQLQEAGAKMDVEGRKCFEMCAENLYDELYAKGKKAGLSEHLLEEIEERFIEEGNTWFYEVGWKKVKAKNPLPDVYKVLFFNYGTPRRTAKAGGQRVQIDGKWVTLGTDRGEESPHPEGSHGFIKKAKLAAVQRNKKVQREALAKILGGLKK